MSALAALPSEQESPQEHASTTAVLASGRTLIHERMSGAASHQPLSASSPELYSYCNTECIFNSIGDQELRNTF